MATGVKPRDEETQLTRSDLEAIQDAMKNKKFRDLLTDYCEEIRDPANQALYQKEMVQLEKERGYDISFINPKGGYVIKTSVAGDRKAFINICSNEIVGKPSYEVQELNGKKGMNWQIPYSLIPPREDFDHKRQRCVIYDVVFHPDTLRMAEANKQFREIVNKTALDELQTTYNINLDSNNFRYPKSLYKGMTVPAVIRKEDPDYKAPEEDDTESISQEILDKLYPQHTYPDNNNESIYSEQPKQQQRKKAQKPPSSEFVNTMNSGYTVPKYVIKQQQNVDFQDFTYHRDSKQYSAIPSQILIEIYLPLLSSTADCILNVKEKSLELVSEKPAKYKLNISLPYSVNDECGSAKFDKSKHKLIVTLPVIRHTMSSTNIKCLKADSGVESEENSQSDEDSSKDLIQEISSTTFVPSQPELIEDVKQNTEPFFEASLGYILPSYTHNILDEIIAFTFHVKNTEPDSVKVKTVDNNIYIKFTSVGSGFVPVHYAATIVLDDNIKFENVFGEAWDNNVILHLELVEAVPQKFKIGIDKDSLKEEYFDMSQIKKTSKTEEKIEQIEEKKLNVEVTNLDTETKILISSNQTSEYDDDDDDLESPTSLDKDIVWTDSGNNENGAKSILRKPMHMMRSYSECSSVGDIASSMDYISSDCIPEESSLKKSVRFSNIIARQFYRHNSSIEGQKKKNQRKKSKKRSQERHKSESEAEDETCHSSMTSKSRLKSVLKQRRDSGLADTSDAETESKNSPDDNSINIIKNDDRKSADNFTPTSVLNVVQAEKIVDPVLWETATEKSSANQGKAMKSETFSCEKIKHNTDLYDPDRLNKGKYLNVAFKNDLIFDLDM